MRLANKIRFAKTPETDRIERDWAEQFKRLSGFDWPPRNAAEWTIILTRAGFNQTRIEQFLETVLGVEGFDAGELPHPYQSAGKDEIPLFTPSLISGLERWRAAHPENHPAASGIPPEFRTVAMTKRKAAKYLRTGNVDSAVEWLNKCIADGTIPCETLSRQSHVFDVRKFPENVRSKILPAPR